MRNYQYFLSELQNARRQEDPGKPIARNTRLYRRRHQDCLVIRFHATEIIQYWADGSVEINMGGWYTRTTVDRINEFSPIRVFTRRRVRTEDPLWCFTKRGGWPWRYNRETGRHEPVNDAIYILGDPHHDSGTGYARLDPNKTHAPRNQHGDKLTTWNQWCQAVVAGKRRERRERLREAAKRRKAKAYAAWLIDNGMQDAILVEADRRQLIVRPRERELLSVDHRPRERDRVILLERSHVEGETPATVAGDQEVARS